MRSVVILCFSVCAFIMSCTPFSSIRLYKNEDAASSVYKIVANEYVDIRPLKKIMAAAGYDVSGAPDIQERSWGGTAWVIGGGDETSYVMTAGHICESDTVFHTQLFGDLPIVGVSYSVESASGTTNVALMQSDNDDIDLCTLSVEANLGRPLMLASSDPVYGAEIEYIGAPGLIWGGGIAPIYKGLFSGRGTPWGGEQEVLAVTVTSTGGASGSPVLYNGMVIGVFTADGREFKDFGSAVPWDVVQKFWKKSLWKV